MEAFAKGLMYLGMFVLLLVGGALISLVTAFPLKWTWNYVMPYLFEFKAITWGHAWCLSWVTSVLIQSSLSHNSSR